MNAPPLTLYCPPTTETGVPSVMPLILAGRLAFTLPGSTLKTGASQIGAGTWSVAMRDDVVTVKSARLSPIVTEALRVADGCSDACTSATTISPSAASPGASVNAPPLI